ncbi:MAG: pyrophosphokinae [Candidatus Peribacteria bacterium]|nr:pyrophosphokinae [Candidatus Peribacteria bacterium]
MTVLVSSSVLLREELELSGLPAQTVRMQKALRMAETFYAGKTHWVGIPLMDHVRDVLRVLTPFQPDEDAVIACLLHHALEMHTATLVELEQEFGLTLRNLISGVHLLSQVQMQKSRNSVDDLRLMLLSVSDDVRVILIILCDRVSLLEYLADMKSEDRKWICQNMLHLFAPVASRLGIHALKQRMENAAFPVLYPVDASRIAEQVQQLHSQVGNFLAVASQELVSALAEQGIASKVQGREKQLYSIFGKMKAQTYSHINHLYDLFALRILVETEEDCYRALGVVHRVGRPASNRFKDYIAFPKPNGYRSLHTTLARFPAVPEGTFLEVQIRTYAMHREAEYGIAAHWSYKEKGSSQKVLDRTQLQEVLTRQNALEPDAELSGAMVDHIFVLSPAGDIVELPEGATPLDFAFQIHTQLGLSFKAARVNGSIVPLNYELENGDVVEVVRHKHPQPSSEWLSLVKMASSRARLKRYLFSLHRDEYVGRGRDMVNEELKKLHLELLDTDYSILRSWEGRVLTFADREDLLMKIGQGSERVLAVLGRVDALEGKIHAPVRVKKRKQGSVIRNASDISVEGGMPMPIRYAKCCKPHEGTRETIIGFIGRGSLMIHRQKCRMVKASNSAKKVAVKWTIKKL